MDSFEMYQPAQWQWQAAPQDYETQVTQLEAYDCSHLPISSSSPWSTPATSYLHIGSEEVPLTSLYDESESGWTPQNYDPMLQSVSQYALHNAYQREQQANQLSQTMHGRDMSFSECSTVSQQSRSPCPSMRREKSHSREPSDDETIRPRCWDHGCGGKEFSCAENYRRHVRERSRSTAIQCPHCLVSFSRKSNRATHLAKGRCRALSKSSGSSPRLRK